MNLIRQFLYPLGFLSTLLFGTRVLIQWLQSEREGKSILTPVFWKISLAGNLIACLHCLIQGQFPLACVQTTNGIISWRNLNFSSRPNNPASFRFVLFFLFFSLMTVTALFLTISFLAEEPVVWMRVPMAPWDSTHLPSPFWAWHLIGAVGYALFSGRFWVQWWYAERQMACVTTPIFWWMSLIGAFLSSLYFFYIQDSANLIGLVFGFIPYIRNLILSYSVQKRAPLS